LERLKKKTLAREGEKEYKRRWKRGDDDGEEIRERTGGVIKREKMSVETVLDLVVCACKVPFLK
jgi:hypothetical protein